MHFLTTCLSSVLWVVGTSTLLTVAAPGGHGAAALPPVALRDAYPALTFERPLWMEEAPDGSKRTFLVEQPGRVWLLPRDKSGAEKSLFLDMTDRKPLVQNEEGLLAFAFHPQFKANGRFYVYNKRPSGTSSANYRFLNPTRIRRTWLRSACSWRSSSRIGIMMAARCFLAGTVFFTSARATAVRPMILIMSARAVIIYWGRSCALT
jgi:hypothetical protein